MKFKIPLLILAFAGIFTYFAHRESRSRESQGEVATPEMFQLFKILVVFNHPNGKLDCAEVNYDKLPLFTKGLMSYSYKIPAGKEEEVWRCVLEKSGRDWSTRNSLRFVVQKTEGDRQRIMRSGFNGDSGVNTWYWAGDHEAVPEMIRPFHNMVYAGLAIVSALLTGAIVLVLRGIEWVRAKFGAGERGARL